MHPSIPAIVFLIWTATVAFIFPHRLLNSDGDLLRHLRHGEWMLSHGSLIHVDPFSFTKGGQPFVGFEYGSQLIYALVHRAGGLAGIALFAALLIAASYALLTRFLLARGVDPLLTYLVSIAAAVLGAVHWSPRPHLFTLIGVMILLSFLEPGQRRRVWPLAPLFAVWANLHGGFVFGLMLLGIYFAGSALEMLIGADRAAWRDRALYYARAIGVASFATLLNPHGWELHRHIVTFFGEPFLRDNTQEFFSPDFHTAGGKLLLLAILGICALFAFARERPTGPRLLLTLANIAFALQARRNIPLLGATVLPALAIQYDALWRRLPDWRGIRAVFERDARRGSTAPLVGITTVALVLLALAHGRAGSWQLVPERLDPKEFPIAAVAEARREGIQGRMFHDFVWGGYLLYAWPEQKVFIDGGTDFYGKELMGTHMSVSALEPGWRDTLDTWKISLVLLPPWSPVVGELARDGDWRVRYCDRTAALLERRGKGIVGAASDATSSLARCLDRRPADSTIAGHVAGGSPKE